MNLKNLCGKGIQQIQPLFFSLSLLTSGLCAEPLAPAAPLAPQYQEVIVIIRPLTVFERLRIMAEMPLIHYCVVGITYSTIAFWPFSWPNGIERIRYYLWSDDSDPKAPVHEDKQTGE